MWMRSVIGRLHDAIEARLPDSDELTAIADQCDTDKGTLHNAHRYTLEYHRLFRRFRSRPCRLLEIGLLRAAADKRRRHSAAEGQTDAQAVAAPSLQMWRRYFPKARLYGFDIDDFSAVRIEGCTIVRGDMSSRADLDRLIREIGGPVDIVIDDGSHASHHQQIAFGTLLPSVRPGGLYIIEDLDWQNARFERPGAPKTQALLKRLQAGGPFDSPYLTPPENAYIAAYAASVRFFDSRSRKAAAGNGALGVVRKR
jgi:hypothetical protein